MPLWRFYVFPGWQETSESDPPFQGTADEAERRCAEIAARLGAPVCASEIDPEETGEHDGTTDHQR